MICRKAIIPVAGYGTRRLPVTKAVEKAMLPVLNRPIIDYVVEDCIKAGMEEIIFVVSEGGATQLEAYYSHDRQLEEYLQKYNKEQYISSITPPDVTFAYVVQRPEIGYGTAVPVALCRDLIPAGESALVLMGDDFLYRDNGGSDVADMLEAVTGDNSAMLGVQVANEKVSHYGVLRLDGEKFVEIVEKPTKQSAPSNFINVSKYVMNSELLDCVADYAKESIDGEYLITEPINRFVNAGGIVQVHPNKGEYCDGGTLEGWITANNYLYNLKT